MAKADNLASAAYRITRSAGQLKGWSDVLPKSWFTRPRPRPVLKHRVVKTGEDELDARCSLKFPTQDTAELKYTKKNNDGRKIEIGVMRIQFENANRRRIRDVSWKSYRGRQFRRIDAKISEMSPRNPVWSRDELILALELYVKHGGNPPNKKSKDVVEVSELLNKLRRQLKGTSKEFRDPNGVCTKVKNFQRFDPNYTSTGHVDLQGGREEEHVWNDFANDPKRLRMTAAAIRDSIRHGGNVHDGGDFDSEGTEGGILTQQHRRRERNREVVQRKKASVLERLGRLACEACDFEFGAIYGERGEGYIEVHHKVPLYTLQSKTTTRLDDLAVLCANCHRMVHATKDWLTLESLKNIIHAGRHARH